MLHPESGWGLVDLQSVELGLPSPGVRFPERHYVPVPLFSGTQKVSSAEWLTPASLCDGPGTHQAHPCSPQHGGWPLHSCLKQSQGKPCVQIHFFPRRWSICKGVTGSDILGIAGKFRGSVAKDGSRILLFPFIQHLQWEQAQPVWVQMLFSCSVTCKG